MDPIGDGPKTDAVALFQFGKRLPVLTGQAVRQANESAFPGSRQIEPPVVDKHLVYQAQRLQPPGVPVVSRLEPKKVKQQVQVSTLIGLGR